MNQYRIKRLMQMMDDQVPDLSSEPDLDLMVLTDHKFMVKDHIDTYHKLYDRVTPGFIDHVLNEMINIKSMYGGQEAYERNEWITTDSDKLILGGLYKNSYKTKCLDAIYQQQERKRME